jgi:hypothetical protein
MEWAARGSARQRGSGALWPLFGGAPPPPHPGLRAGGGGAPTWALRSRRAPRSQPPRIADSTDSESDSRCTGALAISPPPSSKPRASPVKCLIPGGSLLGWAPLPLPPLATSSSSSSFPAVTLPLAWFSICCSLLVHRGACWLVPGPLYRPPQHPSKRARLGQHGVGIAEATEGGGWGWGRTRTRGGGGGGFGSSTDSPAVTRRRVESSNDGRVGCS